METTWKEEKNWLEPFNAYRRFLKMIIPSYVSALLNYVDGDDDESFWICTYILDIYKVVGDQEILNIECLYEHD